MTVTLMLTHAHSHALCTYAHTFDTHTHTHTHWLHVRTYMTLIGMHKIRGRMHPPINIIICILVTDLLSMTDSLSSPGYPMIIYTHTIAENLLVKKFWLFGSDELPQTHTLFLLL